MHGPTLRAIALWGLALAILLPTQTHAAPEDCLENGGQAQCMPAVPTPTEWQHSLCDDMAAFSYRWATWCSVLGGVWQGNYAPCLGRDTNIVESEVFPYADNFARQVHNVQHCPFQSEDRGWLAPGKTLTSWHCWSGGPTYQNGIEVGNLREILFSGQGIDYYTKSCGGQLRERIVVIRGRSIQPGCPADFSLRTNAAGQSECYKLNPCQVSLVGLPADVEPGARLKGLVAAVTCGGQAQTGIPVALESEVIPFSGGHGHNDPQRPKGSVPATVLSGTAFAFVAPIVAGDHQIKAACVQHDCGSAKGKVSVEVRGLATLQSDPAYVLITPNGDKYHLGNHYVSAVTQSKIRSLASAYHKLFPNDPLLHLNDASLKRGGLFDIARNWSTRPKGHSTHRYGTDIDVRSHEFYHDPKSSVPTYNYIDFMLLAPRRGCSAGIHSGGSQNEHFHLYCR